MNYANALDGVTTCDLSDACDAIGVAAATTGAIKPVWNCGPICGPVTTLKLSPTGKTEIVIGTLVPIMGASKGAVLLVDADGDTERNTIGSLASMVSVHRGLAGAIVNGCVRDLQGIEELRFPVYARGTVVQSVRGRVGIEAINEPVSLGGRTVAPGWIAAADRNGIIAFPADVAPEVIRAARRAVEIEKDIFAQIRSGADPVKLHEDLRYTSSMKDQLTSSI
jgi:4-hydroxy-4-methyl-2-oxoglutarate aldolase